MCSKGKGAKMFSYLSKSVSFLIGFYNTMQNFGLANFGKVPLLI